MSDKSGLSVRTVTLGVMAVIALFGWAFAATAYAHSIEAINLDDGRTIGNLRFRGGAGGLMMMVYSFFDLCKNAVVQIPSLFSVVAFAFRERIGIPIAVGVLELLAGGAGFKLAAMERELDRPKRRR